MLNEIKNIRKRIKELEMMRALNRKTLQIVLISPGTSLEIMKEIREQDRQIEKLRDEINQIKHRFIWLSLE